MNRDVSTQVSSQAPQPEQPAAQLPFQQQPMKATPPLQSQGTISNVATGIGNQETDFLGWWYRLTCPKISPEAAKSVEGREKIRKARLASLTLLVLIGFTIVPIPSALISQHDGLLGSLLISLLTYLIGLVCTRRNHLALAGFLTIMIFELTFVAFLLSMPGGFDIKNLPALDILLEASLVSVAFFRPWSVFIVAAINIAIILTAALFMPKSPDLVAYLQGQAYSVLQPSITLQLFVAFIVYVWVTSAYKAILRADQAEEIAELERREVERRQQEIEKKKQLDYGIEQILGSLNKVANGDTHVKVPLDQNNVLWRVGYSINNLLARIQAFREERAELVRTKQVAAILTEALKHGQLPNFNEWTHTCLDALVVELRKTSNWQQSQIGSSLSPDQKNLRNS